MRTLLAVALAVASATACTDGGGGATPTTFAQPGDDIEVAGVGEPVPDGLVFVDFDGSERALAEYDGRPLVLNFFASWCRPCVQEMPDIESVFEARGDEIAFVGLSVNDTADDSLALVEQTGVTYDTARDPRGEILTALGGVVMPTTFLIDADGTIVAAHSGEINKAELLDLIEEHLA